MTKKFDVYISLGNNCECGMEMKAQGYDNSSFFRYTFCPFESLCKILENNFQNIFQFENLSPHAEHMLVDTQYNIYFHTEMISEKIDNNFHFIQSEEERKAIYEKEYAKVKYLIQKWKQQIQNNLSIAYFIKSPSLLQEHQLRQLVNLLLSYGSTNFSLVYCALEEYNLNLNIPHLHIETLKFYAPYYDVTACDKIGYNTIFKKYGLL